MKLNKPAGQEKQLRDMHTTFSLHFYREKLGEEELAAAWDI